MNPFGIIALCVLVTAFYFYAKKEDDMFLILDIAATGLFIIHAYMIGDIIFGLANMIIFIMLCVRFVRD